MLSQPWIERGGADKQARGIETWWGRRCRVVVGVPHRSLLDGCGRRLEAEGPVVVGVDGSPVSSPIL